MTLSVDMSHMLLMRAVILRRRRGRGRGEREKEKETLLEVCWVVIQLPILSVSVYSLTIYKHGDSGTRLG